MITEDYVSFEVAKLLRKKEFESDYCHTAYDSEGKFFWHGDYSKERKGIIDAPTLQMAMKWLREEKGVQIEIPIVGMDTWESPTKWMYGFRCQTKNVIDRKNADFSSYEQACEEAIKYCLEKLV